VGLVGMSTLSFDLWIRRSKSEMRCGHGYESWSLERMIRTDLLTGKLDASFVKSRVIGALCEIFKN
jgi:hypothetical protein